METKPLGQSKSTRQRTIEPDPIERVPNLALRSLRQDRVEALPTTTPMRKRTNKDRNRSINRWHIREKGKQDGRRND